MSTPLLPSKPLKLKLPLKRPKVTTSPQHPTSPPRPLPVLTPMGWEHRHICMQFMSFNNVRSQNISNIPEILQYAHVLFLDLPWQKGGMTRVIGGSEEMGNAITRLADFCTDSVCFLRFLCKLKNSATSADFNLPHLAHPHFHSVRTFAQWRKAKTSGDFNIPHCAHRLPLSHAIKISYVRCNRCYEYPKYQNNPLKSLLNTAMLIP